MKTDYNFDPTTLNTVLGGASTLDIPRLNIQNLDQAHRFIRAYGYNLSLEEDLRKVWLYYRRAVAFIRTELLKPDEEIPAMLADPTLLQDVAYLLIYASTLDQRENSVQRWACAILRVMHVLSHLENDLFTRYSTEIQSQVISPFQTHIFSDPEKGIQLGAPLDPEQILLKKFDVKAFKTSNSSILKLLAKREALAFSLLDKVGVRFVTRHLFDVFRVIRFLFDKSLVSFPHVIPDQSNNTLYPFNLFVEVLETLTKETELTSQELDQMLTAKLAASGERAEYREKPNSFSSREYRFVKFISRRLIHVESENLRFYYPYEVQIIDYPTYLQNASGSSSHESYKERQREMARRRFFGVTPKPKGF